jgi:hypothetical protein
MPDADLHLTYHALATEAAYVKLRITDVTPGEVGYLHHWRVDAHHNLVEQTRNAPAQTLPPEIRAR